MSRAAAIPDTMTVHVPFRTVKRGRRKEIRLPPGAPSRPELDSALVKALARAFRWDRMLRSGEVTTIAELAEREKIAFTYMARVLRLTLLSPEIVEAIVRGNQPPSLRLARLLEPFPGDWNDQKQLLLSGN